MYEISITSNLAQVTRALSALAYKQLPFATALGLNDIAGDVVKAEQAQLHKELDRPTPFTVKAVRFIPARKGSPQVVIFVQDRAAWYLEPYEVGGLNKLNSAALLVPVKQPKNQYGNLPRGIVARLTGGRKVGKLAQWAAGGVRPKVKQSKTNARQVFAGTVKGISGVWRRKGRRLVLLVRFTDAHQASQRIHYQQTGARVVGQVWAPRFGAAMARAIAMTR